MNERLANVLNAHSAATIALSGGVDSMTLAFAAHQIGGRRFVMIHAVSPAVPETGTERVKKYAAEYGWRLDIVDAKEIEDPNYRANPFDRCFYCKSNLYATLSKYDLGTVMSGTNIDDLSDFRPGLKAADDFKVIHPFVEAGLNKSDIRALANEFGLSEIADLPSSPCLASRVETGIRIDPDELKFIDDAERMIQNRLDPKTVRCRLRRDKIVISLDTDTLMTLSLLDSEKLRGDIEKLGASLFHKPVVFGAYKQGDAFVRPG